MRSSVHIDSETWSAKMRTPFAVLGIRSNGTYITNIAFLSRKVKDAAPSDALSERVIREVQCYLDDPMFRFSVPIMPHGTPFQQRVWKALQSIPSGEPSTYGEIARRLDTAPRAVGGACGANPIVLVIPCHRVVGRHSLGGFMHAEAGDPLRIKRWLLDHEETLGNERDD